MRIFDALWRNPPLPQRGGLRVANPPYALRIGENSVFRVPQRNFSHCDASTGSGGERGGHVDGIPALSITCDASALWVRRGI
jgi:hypothetical protein